MRGRVIRVRYFVSESLPQLRKEQWNGAIHGNGVALHIGAIVRYRAHGEGELVKIGRLIQQNLQKIRAPDIMHQIAEITAAKWIVTKVLDDRAPIGVGVGFVYLLLCGIRKTLEEYRPDGVGPQRI